MTAGDTLSTATFRCCCVLQSVLFVVKMLCPCKEVDAPQMRLTMPPAGVIVSAMLQQSKAYLQALGEGGVDIRGCLQCHLPEGGVAVLHILMQNPPEVTRGEALQHPT